MTEQYPPDPDRESAEAVMDWAASRLRSHMNSALAAINPHRELLANLVHAGLVAPPSHDPGDGDAPTAASHAR